MTGRSDATATNDENADGVVDSRDDAIAAERAEQIDDRAEGRVVRGRRDGTADVAAPVDTSPREPLVTDRVAGTVDEPTTTGRFATVDERTPADDVVPADERTTTGRFATVDERTATGRVAPVDERTTTGPVAPVTTDTETVGDETEPAAVPRGPRPRASLFATLGLLFGVVAAATVLTGMLADFGIALGVVGALFSLGGFSATARRHVAGRFDAVLGFFLSLAAVVIGVLAVTNSLSWLSLDTDTIPTVHTWLHEQWNAITGG